MSPSTDTAVRTPIASSAWTRSSSGRLPEASGANGHPPRPPTLPSMRTAPASSAASALAMARPRVSCRCTPTGSPVADRTAVTSDRTSGGVATPMVSASEIALGPDGGSPLGRRHDRSHRHLELVGAAEGGGQGELHDGVLGPGQRDHVGERGQRGGSGLPRVLPAVRVAHRHDVLEVTEPRGEGALRTASVQGEGPPGDLARPRGGRGEHLGVGQRGDHVGAHEARELEIRDPGGHQRVEDGRAWPRCRSGRRPAGHPGG